MEDCSLLLWIYQSPALARFEPVEGDIVVRANGDVVALMSSGVLINEPIVGYKPFVMNNETEIQQGLDTTSADFMAELV
jgi:redox-sensitive bicupin YhaK (pirin superfamily)